MTYIIELKKSAAKALRKLPKAAQKRIVAKLTEFETSLPPAEETKMKGNNPFHRVRVGDFRIIFEIQNDILVILVLKIGHRKDIYRHIS
ncbi:MAG: type II toxin-antitoxin system RelE/ParE family toxin [Proteobacteria bacterium]|nr:type II toxin-antitoxin system RelE/ParE family toxin [Pseudomonadota bacterium]